MRIERNETNVVALTLTEKVTVTNPTFLFSFKSPENELINFICADTSVQTDRYNLFSIVEVGNSSGSIDLTDGHVQLLPNGQWSYIVYAQTDANNLDPDNADEIVETGMLIVFDPNNPAVTFSEPSTNTDTYSMPNE